MRHALVTGATGGLGREVVRQLLAAGYRVTATGRNRAIGGILPTRFIPADLVRDDLAPLIDGIDAVFHLAANSSPWGRHSAFHSANVIASRRLLAAAQAKGANAFIYASTPSIYAEARDRLDLTEDSSVAARFANAYAATKFQAELEILAANTHGFATLTIRPRAIIGPHDSVLLPRLLRASRKGKLPVPGSGKALVELTDVRDVAAAFVAADVHRDRAAGKSINISGGDSRPVRDVLSTVFDHMGRCVRLQNVPIGLAMTSAMLMERAFAVLPGYPEPPVTRYSVMVFAYSQTMCLDRARALLDWRPLHSTEQAIAHALGNVDA